MRIRLLALGGLASLALLAAMAQADGAARVDAQARPLVAQGDYLVGDKAGRLLVLDAGGHTVRRVPRRVVYPLQGIEIAPDRRHAFVAFQHPDRLGVLVEVDLATGARRFVAHAISPTLSPDGRELAYVRTRGRKEIIYRTAIEIRDLATGKVERIPLPDDIALGTPPENVINWAPDGASIAVYDGRRIRLAEASANGRLSEPVAPPYFLAPVFLGRDTLIALANCCIGRQRLVRLSLSTTMRRPFATLPAPPESIRQLGPRSLLVVTAAHGLMVVRPGDSRRVRGRISVAAR